MTRKQWSNFIILEIFKK